MQYNLFPIIIPLILIILLLLILWRIRLKKLKVYNSPFGKIEIFEKYNQERVLTINSYIQGISTNDKSVKKSYWFEVAKQCTNFCQKRKKPQVLMLGLGANTISNLIAKLNPQIHQTIVEIDEHIIQACKDFFGLNQLPNHTLLKADAYQLFSRTRYILPVTSYDVIIVDIFTGNPPYVSLKSNTPNFIEKILPYLKKDGVMIFNRPGHNLQVQSDSQKLKEYLDTLFKKTELFDIKDPRGFRNNVITASSKRPN